MFFEPRTRGTKFRAKVELTAVKREPIPYQLMTLAQMFASVGKEFICDVECYVNYFLVAFRCVDTDKVCYVEMIDGEGELDTDLLSFMMWQLCTVGFNSNRYDNIMIAAALAGLDCGSLKRVSDSIIKEGLRDEEIAELYNLKLLRKINNIDLAEVAPLPGEGSAGKSLKIYAARMHAKRIQELPYPEYELLTSEQIGNVRNYCIGSDTVNTKLLLTELREQINLRIDLGKRYDIDLRSKSDAQIAEAVIISEITKLTGYKPKKPEFDLNYTFKYTPPAYIHFQTPELQAIFERIKGLTFGLRANGAPYCEELTGNKDNGTIGIIPVIGGKQYVMGLGGLHSTEKNQTIVAESNWGLFDTDFESFYPKMILNNEWFPKHLGRAFLIVFAKIVSDRLSAKDKAKLAKALKDKDDETAWKVIADSLKITINGSFGKLGSIFSILFSPDLLVQTTVTGQLTLMMLIEACEQCRVSVVSANTDGFVVHLHESQRATFDAIVKGFEALSNLKTEETAYKALYSRDVNSYIAVKTDGEVKVKGEYSEKGSTANSRLSKNPQALIVSDAVVAFLTKGVPLAKTIKECRDVRRFVSVKNVKGGGHINGLYLGKTVRWIYAKGVKDTINYTESGNTVGDSYGAFPLMDLPDEFPDNLDHNRYLQYALSALVDIGYTKQPGLLF